MLQMLLLLLSMKLSAALANSRLTCLPFRKKYMLASAVPRTHALLGRAILTSTPCLPLILLL